MLRKLPPILTRILLLPLTFLRRRLRGCCLLRAAGCLGVLLLLAALAGALFWTVSTAEGAAAQPPDAAVEPLAVYLLIDNSNSMFEKGGRGADPDLLRLDAARLFISYLGVDDGAVTHACGVIYFGSTPQLVVPLTDLNSAERRAELFDLLADPPRLGWTDHTAALALAAEQLRNDAGTRGRPVLVLVTDGKPEWDTAPTAAEQAATVATLREQGDALAAAGIPLFIILLANEATDADPAIASFWQPLWRELSGATPPGRFYEARRPLDLVDIYHDIVVTLTGSRSDGAVLQTTVAAEPVVETITVEPDLARLTLVIRKSDPALTVAIRRPDGTLLTTGQPGVRHAGEPGVTREEVWAVDDPAAGAWQVRISGAGSVTVWKDVRPAAPAPVTPTPTPSPTPLPSTTASPWPTATATPWPTATPQPRLQVAGLPPAVLAGQPLTVTARLLPPPAAWAALTLTIDGPDGGVTSVPLLDDGRQGDRRADDGVYAARVALAEPGAHLLVVEAGSGGMHLARWETRLLVEAEPALVLALGDERPRDGATLALQASWVLGPGQPAAVTPAPLVVEATWAAGRRARLTLTPDETGLLRGELPLDGRGALTLRGVGTARTAAGQRVTRVTQATLEVRPSFPWPGLAAALLLPLAGGSALTWRAWQRRRPLVSGTLRHVAGPPLPLSAPGDLARLRRPVVTIGPAPADILLPAAPGTLRLKATRGGIVAAGDAALRINDRPLRVAQPLADRDRLTLGETILVYENLRLAAQPAWHNAPSGPLRAAAQVPGTDRHKVNA